MKRYSIIHDMKKCFICGTEYNLHKHEVFFGTANRTHSIENGLVVALCCFHHNGGGNGKCVHQCREMDLQLKQIAQKKFEETRSREEFIKIFGKNYLD